MYNTGIAGKTDHQGAIFPANTITVDMFGNAFFRDFDYKMATHAHVFSLSFLDTSLTVPLGLFLCASMSYFKQLFSFSNMCNWKKMASLPIWLPVTDTGNIDYDFIQTYITALEKVVIKKTAQWADTVISKTKKTVYTHNST